MPLDYDSIDTLYSFGVSDSAWLDDQYSFTVTVPEYATLVDTYSYYRSKGERYEPQQGFWSPFAQAIGNEFPYWHAARTNFFSRTQRFLNIFAQPLWDFDQRLQYERRNRYVSTVDMFQPDSAHRIGVNVELHREIDSDPKNLLRNPDFSIPGLARYNMPWRWTDRFSSTTGTVEHYTDNALIGYGCVRMLAADGESCFLRQNVIRTLGVQDKVTASAFVLVPIPETAGTSEGDLVMTVFYADGTSSMQKTALPAGTDGYWRRISVTINPTKRVSQVDFMVAIVNSLGHDYEIFVDACQLELGPAPTSFSRLLAESPSWMTQNLTSAPYFIEALGAASSRTIEHVTGSPTTYNEYERYRVWPTADQYDWWLNAIPTRLDVPVVDTTGYEPTVKVRYGVEANAEDRARRAAQFQISTDKTKIEWAIEDTPIDVLFDYQIADHNMDGGGYDEYGIPGEEDDGYSITIEAITVHKDMLWVVALETWNGTTIRVIKICHPFQRPDVLADSDQENFLETIQDYNLGLASGTVSAIGFAEGDDSKLLLTLDGSEYVANLWYDYAFYDEEVATSALLRHNYQGKDLVLR